LPPQKTADETKRSYRIFADYVAFMKRFPDVQFITASEAARLYADRAQGRTFTLADIARVAKGVGDEITYQKHDGYTLTASEALGILAGYVSLSASGKAVQSFKLQGTPLGPTGKRPALSQAVTTDASQFVRTTRDVAAYLTKHNRVPSSVWLGS